jgi:hypothetical protein
MITPRLALCLTALCWHAGAIRVAAQRPGGTTTYTSLVDFHTNHVITTYETASVQTYATLLEARMPGGPVLFSQWLAVSYLDPQFTAAVLQAQSALTASGAVGFTGPTLGSSENLIADVSTTCVRTGYSDPNTLRPDQMLVATREWVGETQFVGGYFGLCTDYTLLNQNVYTEFYVLPTGCTGGALETVIVRPGDTVLETRAALFLDPLETETTTTTRQLRQRYEMVGVPATTTVPEPSTLALAVSGLAALLAGRRWRDRRSRRG